MLLSPFSSRFGLSSSLCQFFSLEMGFRVVDVRGFRIYGSAKERVSIWSSDLGAGSGVLGFD